MESRELAQESGECPIDRCDPVHTKTRGGCLLERDLRPVSSSCTQVLVSFTRLIFQLEVA